MCKARIYTGNIEGPPPEGGGLAGRRVALRQLGVSEQKDFREITLQYLGKSAAQVHQAGEHVSWLFATDLVFVSVTSFAVVRVACLQFLKIEAYSSHPDFMHPGNVPRCSFFH